MREREVPDQGPGLDSVNELSPPPTEPHHDVRDERARDVAWNGWIDDHRDHGSVTRELMAAFDAGWAAAVSAAAPDERGLPGVWETWQRPGAHPSVASEYAAMEAGWTAALAARPAPAVDVSRALPDGTYTLTIADGRSEVRPAPVVSGEARTPDESCISGAAEHAGAAADDEGGQE